MISLEERRRTMEMDKKWWLFKRRTGWLRLVPFAIFGVGAGSMALGTAREESDFDLIVGAMAGRIWTVRFFSVLVFELAGVRRRRLGPTRNRICLNYFVSPGGYVLSSPYDDYCFKLYKSLVPIWGERREIEKFLKANSWAGDLKWQEDGRFEEGGRVWPARFLEGVLGGGLGDWLERVLKFIQIKKIKRSLKKDLGYKPRIVLTDKEIELHPNTRRIEKYVERFIKIKNNLEKF